MRVRKPGFLARYDPQRLGVTFKTVRKFVIPCPLVEHLLPSMTKRRVPDVVGEARCFNNIRVKPAPLRDLILVNFSLNQFISDPPAHLPDF